MNQLLIVSIGGLWAGVTLLLSTTRSGSRPPLADRLRPYLPGGLAGPGGMRTLSVESFAELVRPVAWLAGERLARFVGVTEPLETRLRRIHSRLDPTAFRVRQAGWSMAGFALGTLATVLVDLPAPVGLLFVLGGPLLAFLLVEQQLAAVSQGWQRRLFLELPVVAEQLAMLLSAGYSLSSAMERIADRGRGACARDLMRVVSRIRQGLSETAALREWAILAKVPALDRVVAVLALNREATDLGRLLSSEARAARRDVQRELVEAIERRGEQVWIPVTVATLLPGVIFLAIPFIEALALFAG